MSAHRGCLRGRLSTTFGNRQPEPKDRTVSEFAVDACFSMVIQDDVFDDRQSQARAPSLA